MLSGLLNVNEQMTVMCERSYALDNEGIEVGQGVKGRLGGNLQVLLLELASDGVLVAENKVQLERGPLST